MFILHQKTNELTNFIIQNKKKLAMFTIIKVTS